MGLSPDDRARLFFDNLMLDLLEDDLGLWEINGLARNELAPLPAEQRTQRAKVLINDLLARGWVNVFERTVDYLPGNEAALGPPMALDPRRLASVLSDGRAWDYEAIGHAPARFFVRISERGKSEFKEDARRRGLLRS